MAKRLFDLVAASMALVLLAPVMAAAAVAILIASGRPVLYLPDRVGAGGRRFRLWKFRTMRNATGQGGSVVTAMRDPRVFAVGSFLRKTKLDELPQLVNILRGEMSIVGPRPEDAKIVDGYFTPLQCRTLEVRPGLASPGSIYNYTHGEALLAGDGTETKYVTQLMPIKIALELVYLERQSMLYDWRLIGRTLVTIAAVAAGKKKFDDPPEMARARELLAAESARRAA